MLFKDKWAIFQLYSGESIMMPTLYKTTMLCWIFIVLAHWNNSAQVPLCFTWTHDPYFEPTSLWSYCMLSGEAANTNFMVFGRDLHARGEHANQYTTDTVYLYHVSGYVTLVVRTVISVNLVYDVRICSYFLHSW